MKHWVSVWGIFKYQKRMARRQRAMRQALSLPQAILVGMIFVAFTVGGLVWAALGVIWGVIAAVVMYVLQLYLVALLLQRLAIVRQINILSRRLNLGTQTWKRGRVQYQGGHPFSSLTGSATISFREHGMVIHTGDTMLPIASKDWGIPEMVGDTVIVPMQHDGTECRVTLQGRHIDEVADWIQWKLGKVEVTTQVAVLSDVESKNRLDSHGESGIYILRSVSLEKASNTYVIHYVGNHDREVNKIQLPVGDVEVKQAPHQRNSTCMFKNGKATLFIKPADREWKS